MVYSLFRPIRDKFEDLLQIFSLWRIFFDVCLGAVYTNWDESQGEGKIDSIFVNVLFVVLNASVLLLAIGKCLCYSVLFSVHFSHSNTGSPFRRSPSRESQNTTAPWGTLGVKCSKNLALSTELIT